MTDQKNSENKQNNPGRPSQHRAFFGRVSGKRLHTGQIQLFESLLPKLNIELPDYGQIDPNNLFGATAEQRILEIGYGGGEHLSRLAQQSPQSGFVGCEVFTGGIGKILKTIDVENITNISLFTQDALRLLEVLPDGSLDMVYLLYPDPWPKLRHNKRRFVSNVTLKELARVIKPGGMFRFATDIEDYANWTLAHMVRQTNFIWQTQPDPKFWHIPFEGWQATRYEAKARREGRLESFYFTFVRAQEKLG